MVLNNWIEINKRDSLFFLILLFSNHSVWKIQKATIDIICNLIFSQNTPIYTERFWIELDEQGTINTSIFHGSKPGMPTIQQRRNQIWAKTWHKPPWKLPWKLPIFKKCAVKVRNSRTDTYLYK